MISCVIDMAKYDIAIDSNKLLPEEMKARMFTRTRSVTGDMLPYGLGWFVQHHRDVKMVWHYGYWTANSSLILKVPEHEVTFIVLANTDMLSRPFNLGGGDVLNSVIAVEFLNAFVFGSAMLPDVHHRKF